MLILKNSELHELAQVLREYRREHARNMTLERAVSLAAIEAKIKRHLPPPSDNSDDECRGRDHTR